MSRPAGKRSRSVVPQHAPRQGPRRPRGTGGLYHDAQLDRWIGTATIAGKRHKVTARTKTDAEAALRKITGARSTGAPVDDRSYTVAQTVATFIDRGMPTARRQSKPAPSTAEVYRWTAEVITDRIGKMRLAALTVDDVEAMLDKLAAEGMSAASLHKIRGTLRNAIALAMKRRRISYNVATHATITEKARPTTSRNALTPDAARTLLEALRAETAGLMFGLSLRLGLRPGEAAALTWADVEGNVLHVRHGLRMVHRRPVIVDDLKTAGSERSIELPADLTAWIDEHRRATFGDVIPLRLDGLLMFPTASGRPWNPSNARRLLAAICVRAGVPVVRPNECRHSCASLLSDIGVPNEQIADLLGHTSTRMVQATYRHRLRPVVDVAARADWAATTPS
jgi:integrase